MKYLRTQLATDWPEVSPGGPGLPTRIIRSVAYSLIPKANPGYRDKWHLVDEWLVEFDDDGGPQREVGLDADGRPILAGPSECDYGFWHDTNMRFDQFEGSLISESVFEEKWKESGVVEPD